ncbi:MULTISPECIES: hypothetical protein [Haloferax]|uniref:Phage PhiH1 repressor protein n=1 Tax=Haloferax mediterranei (strain ATCC 33500 / DSM 1411 / JCM 8866 / NBRC 14739 / NCIMB 2177 / R-4) TaxID=523841 RepID=I3R317_HALMT|nr:hypothetical protein [Haloferax mediterranei]AFK18627.1 phage PhiH1 repressor protein [Haloferax mediterranei ATCC 33500]MDX5988718.1 hypothetical protein [Haloferax mediterranei ATCC 33500]
MAYNIDYDRQYVHKRLRSLADVGLLTSEEGVYELTDLSFLEFRRRHTF